MMMAVMTASRLTGLQRLKQQTSSDTQHLKVTLERSGDTKH